MVPQVRVRLSGANLGSSYSLTEAYRLGCLDGIDLPYILQDGLVDFAIYLDHGDSLARLLRVSTAARWEVGDVHFVLPEDRSPPPDYAGYVAIPQVNDVALQRRLNIDFIDAQQARRPAVQYGPNHRALLLSGLQAHG